LKSKIIIAIDIKNAFKKKSLELIAVLKVDAAPHIFRERVKI